MGLAPSFSLNASGGLEIAAEQSEVSPASSSSTSSSSTAVSDALDNLFNHLRNSRERVGSLTVSWHLKRPWCTHNEGDR